MTMVMINEEVIHLNSNTIEFLFKNSRLRPCLRGVEDPVLVGWVSFVLCPPERENKRNQPH